MSRWPKHSLIAGVGLIVVVNAIVLGGVAYNRSSEPESALRLSERELAAPMRGYGNKENSGIALALNTTSFTSWWTTFWASSGWRPARCGWSRSGSTRARCWSGRCRQPG